MTSKTNYIWTILFMGFPIYCFSQDNNNPRTDTSISKKYISGISAGTFISSGSTRLSYYTCYSIESSRHFFAIGPVIGPKIYYTSTTILSTPSTSPGQFRINGLHSIYQFYPNARAKIFDLYFEYTFTLFEFSHKGIDEYSFPKDKPYKSHYSAIENYLGYGLKVKFLKKFYLNQGVDIGLIYSGYSIDYDNGRDIYNGGYGFGLLLKLGLGYKFDKRTT